MNEKGVHFFRSEPGQAKLNKAQELGIPIVDAERFEEILVSGRVPGT